MSRKLTVLIIIGIVLSGVYFFFLTFPIIFIGSPDSVFDIKSFDDEIHSINVEIFDENNNSILQKDYILNPGDMIEFNREVNPFMPIPSKFITWTDGPYTFNFTLDNNISRNITTNPWPYESIIVWLYFSDTEPIDISRVTI